MFLPPNVRHLAYDPNYIDSPIQVSQKHSTTALSLGLFMLDQLELESGHKVLEVGTGTGYYTALMIQMGCDVVTLEMDDEMYQLASKALAGMRVKLIKADGSLGFLPEAPYDRAIIWSASPFLPCGPLSQLREGGVMIVPLQVGERQYLYKVIRTEPPTMLRLIEVLFGKMDGICGFGR
ncbi:protein-L-isoaspartate O-methyltransferase [Sulfodiicoccus acidiphilus]|uniref:protein-L-isoaspartate(D-aspartate) O-methyltransferase n=2 Tax=Sulfodiicoccus acidiphilus TaxID=1670455 RepID=A0A348B3N3_9CREN|nr:protein-L-isoaspartate O-methyltransferase [Sulfodiicoccus acidiphilus]GGT99784.1 protein-L-isoaspartate O-methyltransferase [Sulfodiicoccus acidiphilus]